MGFNTYIYIYIYMIVYKNVLGKHETDMLFCSLGILPACRKRARRVPDACQKHNMNSLKVQFYIDVKADLLAPGGLSSSNRSSKRSSSMPPQQQHQQRHQEQEIRNGVELQKYAVPEANRKLTLFIRWGGAPWATWVPWDP